ncbi:MAG: hypothetical protein J7M13_06145 [Synergistetes bacterium]|nr:hypothetical protein [Synergistota bacterium]
MREFCLITGRTARQGIALHDGKTTESYKKDVAVVFLNEEDMQELGIEDGMSVLLRTDFGRVVVRAAKGNLPRGMAFMPYGPWANLLTSSNTHGVGMPDLKGLRLYISPTEEEIWDWKRVLEEVKKGEN